MKKIALIFFIALNSLLVLGQAPTQGLIAYYPFDNLDVSDHSRYSNHGQIYGNLTMTIDRNGNTCGAINFDGDSYIIVPNSNSLQSLTDEFTFSVWLKFNTGCSRLWWGTVLCKGDSTTETKTNPQYRFQFTKVTFSLCSDMKSGKNAIIPWDMTNENSYEADFWHLWTITYDNGNIKVYIDNNEIFSDYLPLEFYTNYSDLYIGRDIPGKDEFFCGDMDDLRIYNRALSKFEINQIYKTNSNVVCGGNSQPCSYPDKWDNHRIDFKYEYTLTHNKIKLLAKAHDKKYLGQIRLIVNGTDYGIVDLTLHMEAILDKTLNDNCNYIIFIPITKKAMVFEATLFNDTKRLFTNLTLDTRERFYLGIKLTK